MTIARLEEPTQPVRPEPALRAFIPGEPGAGAVYLLRFHTYERLLHGLLMVSFLGLAATGLPLLFSDERWARVMARLAGGFPTTSFLHRVFASALITCFSLHLARIIHRLWVRKDVSILWGPASLTPQPRDFVELYQHVRWFLRLGPRPRFERFSYFEKFDYWAVFWGMAIIGGSGLVLWFPEFFGRLLPGRLFNVALLVHGEEALLAVGFIFTVHFFNTHLRPEKFPVDRVIFTGRLTEEELRDGRPGEFARVIREGTLEAMRVDPPAPWLVRCSSVVSAVMVTIGLTLVGLILYAALS